MTTEEIQKLRNTKTTFNWEQWDLADPLEDQEWSLLACPKCYHSESDPITVLANKDTGDFHCEKCGHLGNAKFAPNKFKGKLNFKNQWWKSPLTSNMLKWFERNYISKATLDALDVSVVNKKYFSQSNTMGFSVAIPCRLTSDSEVQDVHHIKIDPKGGFTNDMMTTVGAKTIPIGMDKINYDHVIVVDNIKDYFSFYESGMTSVICLPNNLDPLSPQTNTWDFLQNIEVQMKQVKKFTFAFPNSERGFAIEEEISRRFGRDRAFRIRWQRDVDDVLEPSAYDVFYEYGEGSLEDEISEAQPFPIKGIYELQDVEDRIDAAYEYGLKRGVSTGFPTLDTHYTVELSQWTLVTGIPGSGKSNFLDGLLVNLSRLHGWKHAIFSPENQPIDRYYASLVEKYVGKAFSKTSDSSKRMTPEELNEGKAFINKHFKVMLPDEEEGNWSVEGILELAKAAVYRHGIKGIVIDPWNEVEHKRPSGMQETDYISYVLTKIRRFAKTHNVHVWIVAHPTKMTKGADGKYPVPTPYDVAGGANWRNKADNALTVHRNVGQIDEDIIDVHVQKIRFKEIGRVGMVSLRGDITCGCYYDDIDQQKRAMSLASPTPLSSKEIRLKAPLNMTNSKMGFTEATPSLFHDPDETFRSL